MAKIRISEKAGIDHENIKHKLKFSCKNTDRGFSHIGLNLVSMVFNDS
jgi:hypothetical protein